MTLKDSRDQTISNAAPPLLTRRKWKSSDAAQHATSALKHNNIVGHVQLGRGGFSLAASKPTWRKASTLERREGCLSCQTGTMDEVGRPGEEKALLEGALGNGGKQHQLHHQSYPSTHLCSHLQKTSTSGMAWTQPVLSVQLQRLSNTS